MKSSFDGTFTDKVFKTNSTDWREFIEKVQGRPVEVTIETTDSRTAQQNKALHKFFTDIASELNGIGIPAKTISLVSGAVIEQEWNLNLVKALIWVPVQKAILGSDSTRLLKTDEIDKISRPILQFLGKQGIGIMFPSQESLHLENESRR